MANVRWPHFPEKDKPHPPTPYRQIFPVRVRRDMLGAISKYEVVEGIFLVTSGTSP